jgi:hypothetical protein
MSLMKSLLMVARTEVLRRNTPGDWSVKDQTSYTKNLHLGCEDDIVKIMQMEGAKCIITWGPRERRGDRTGPGWAWAGRPKPAGLAHSGGRFGPPFLAPEGSSTLKSWRRRHSQRGEPFALRGHPQARERRAIFGGGSPILKEAPTSGEEGRHRRKCHHDQRCYVQHLDGVIFSFVHGL